MASNLRHQFKRHKYGVSPKEQRTVDGITFDSKKEAGRYRELKMLQDAGEVLTFLRQTPFHLPGGTTYRADFQIFWADGSVTFEDVKGVRTRAYVRAKKQVEALYRPITITEV